jgi:replicative DNA helicase
MSIDIGFVMALLKTGKPTAVIEAGITEEFLFDEGRAAFTAALEFYRAHGTMPAVQTLQGLCDRAKAGLQAHIDEARPTEPLSYYMDALRRRKAAATVASALHSAGTMVEDGKVEEATAAMKAGAARADQLSSSSRVIADAGYFAKKLRDDYELAKKAKDGVFGYRTPWDGINSATAGIVPGDLWVIVARPGVGKTWMMSALGAHLLTAGVKVLIVSMEMPRVAMLRRLLSVKHKIPALDLRKGQLNPFVEERWFEILDQLKTNPMPLTIVGEGAVQTVNDLEAVIDEVQPEVTLLDGLYLLTDGSSGNAKLHEKVAKFMPRLKQVALKYAEKCNMAVVATTQFNREGGDTKPDLSKIGYSDAIGQTVDCGFGMSRDDDMRKLSRMKSFSLKVREGPGDWEANLNWNLTTMDFSEIVESAPGAGPAAQPSGVQQGLQQGLGLNGF